MFSCADACLHEGDAYFSHMSHDLEQHRVYLMPTDQPEWKCRDFVGRQIRKLNYINFISEFLKPLTRDIVCKWRISSILCMRWAVTDLLPLTPSCTGWSDSIRGSLAVCECLGTVHSSSQLALSAAAEAVEPTTTGSLFLALSYHYGLGLISGFTVGKRSSHQTF